MQSAAVAEDVNVDVPAEAPAAEAITTKMTILDDNPVPIEVPTPQDLDSNKRSVAEIPQHSPEPFEGEPSLAQKPFETHDKKTESIEAGEAGLELDDVGEGGLEIVGEVDEEELVSASSNRPVELPELELELSDRPPPAPHLTPPPESDPQQHAPRSFERKDKLETTEVPVAPTTPPQHPSMEMVGQTIDLPEDTSGSANLEIDATPVVTPLEDRSTGEMEADIPGSMAPGLYPPVESRTKEGTFGLEPATKDSELDEPLRDADSSGGTEEIGSNSPNAGKETKQEEKTTKTADSKSAPEQKGVLEQDTEKKVELELQAVSKESADATLQAVDANDRPEADKASGAPSKLQFEKKPTPAPIESKLAEPAQPIAIEKSGQVVRAPELSSESVAAFVGALERKAPQSFLDAIDASLAL
ncbi:MAG: hypothetical protein CSA75_01680 [Sorangium cellulosum]|nr:MAG: hypothetical protein CSA75_01680 [Sorangium cellulosum]